MIKGKEDKSSIYFLHPWWLSFVWYLGVAIGPLMLTLAITIIHIYELEFCDELNEDNVVEKDKLNKDNKLILNLC